MRSACARRIVFLSLFAVFAIPAYAQQTGAIAGKVTDTSGGVLPGVTIEARSNVLPTPRVTSTGPNGEYRMPALPPGTYTVKFELTGMQTVSAAGARAAWPGHDCRRHARRRGSDRGGHRDRGDVARRARFRDDQERRLERADHRRCRSARNIATSSS